MHMSEAYALCRQCMDHNVRVGTVYGHEIDGVIVNVDNANVYIRVPSRAVYGDVYVNSYGEPYLDESGDNRSFYGNPHSNQDVILTLSLFLLLTIVLL